MTDFNQDDLRLAKDLSKLVRQKPLAYDASMKAMARIISALPDPAPLTMADIEWDHDTHYLAEADTKRYGKVVMIREFDGYIGIHMLADHYVARFDTLNPVALTPTGRKYKLVPEGEKFPTLPEGMLLADHKEHGRVAVSSKPDKDGDYRIFYSNHNTNAHYWPYVKKSDLTFLDSGDVRILATEQDFKNAPIGTIVKRKAEDGEIYVAVKDYPDIWSMDGHEESFSNAGMSTASFWTVLELGKK